MRSAASLSDAELVARVRKGDRDAAEALVERLMPVVQKRVAWVLSRRPSARRTSRQDVLDHAQDVFVRLLEPQSKVLEAWDPARGASLATFVGLVAERQVLSTLRSGRRGAWREDPTLDGEAPVLVDDGPDLEARTWSRDLLERLLDHLEEELTPRGRQLFVALYVEEAEPEAVAEQLGMSLNALYSWRSRFKARIQEVARSLETADREASHV